MKAMVLAAGKGTRLTPLTGVMPKPVAPVAGKPLIEYIFELLAASGVEAVHVNTHHLAHVIHDLYGDEYAVDGVPVCLSREEALTGTAGGVKRLAKYFDETFVVIMGDALTDADLPEIVRFHKEKGAIATLALMRVEDTSQYGVVELDGGCNIVSFQEKPDPEDAISTLANTGIYVLEPEALDYVPEGAFFDFARDVFPRLLEAGEKFVGYQGDFYWSDIGTLEAYRKAQWDALSGRVRVKLPGELHAERVWVDPSARLHPSARVEGPAMVGPDVTVDRGAILCGKVVAGTGCRIRSGASVGQSILLPRVHVGGGASLEGCILGPGYHVRDGESVLDRTLVGGAT